MLITLATPIRKDFITENFKYLFGFYTEKDKVQYAGSYEITMRNASGAESYTQDPRKVLREDLKKLGHFKSKADFDKTNIYATKVTHNQSAPQGWIQSHSDIKHLIPALPKVINDLLQKTPNKEYVLNIDLDEQVNLSINEMDSLQFQIQPLSNSP
jgi:hypothetical protein